MRSIEEDGIWFLPSNPEREVPGRLTFSANESPKLLLLDQLQDIEFDKTIPHRLDFEIINGYLTNGKKVTLCHCYQPIGLKTGIQTSTIHAKYLLVGHHFKALEEISLRGVSLRYKNLEEWVDLRNFQIQWTTNEERNQVKEINVKQTTLDPIELGQLLGFSITLYDKPVELERLRLIKFFGNIGRKISLEEQKNIIVKADSERSLDDMINVVYLFQDLLILASGQITYPYDIQSGIVVIEKEMRIPDDLNLALMAGRIKPERVAKSDLGFEVREYGEKIKAVEEEKEKLIPIEIYFQIGELDDLDAKFDSQRVLFDFNDVKEQFSVLLSLWEHNSKELEAIIDLYLRLTYIPKRHINDFFLSLAQAIEAFHSLSHSGRYLEKKIYRSVIRKTLEQAVESIPDDLTSENEEGTLDLREYKRILKEEKLSHLNSYSLRERLEEILSEYGTCLPENFFGSPDEQYDFLKKLRKTRNYLTHLSSKKDKDVLSGQELIVLCRKLKKLLEACLLKQLGLEELKIKAILSKNR
ncbi:MAG: HEPN domain-containing protein [Cyanobacteria bacterium P01_B01_bin.77]